MTVPLQHHPDDAILLDYASGALIESLAVVVACHLFHCPSCRDSVALLERVGGVMLESCAPAGLADDALDRALASLDGDPAIGVAPSIPAEFAALPTPVQDLAGRSGRVKWRVVGPGVRIHWLRAGAGSAFLLRASPGVPVFRHGHRGQEGTVVFAGGYSDATGSYGVGDAVFLGNDVVHQPRADVEGCLCLIATDLPLRLTGAWGLLQRLMRW